MTVRPLHAFVLPWLLACPCGPAASQEIRRETYGDWSLSCVEPRDKDSRVCTVSQPLGVQDDVGTRCRFGLVVARTITTVVLDCNRPVPYFTVDVDGGSTRESRGEEGRPNLVADADPTLVDDVTTALRFERRKVRLAVPLDDGDVLRVLLASPGFDKAWGQAMVVADPVR